MAKVAVTTYEGPSLESLQEKRRRIVRGFVDDGYPEAEYRRRLAEIDHQIAQTTVVAPPAIEKAVELFSNIPIYQYSGMRRPKKKGRYFSVR